jgi:hypothetical protein
MQPRVSQSTACVAPDQNSVAVLMKPRGSRWWPESHWINTQEWSWFNHMSTDWILRRTGLKPLNGDDVATCQNISFCDTLEQNSVGWHGRWRGRWRGHWPYGCDDVAGQPDSFCRSRVKMERGARTARWYAGAVWTSARGGACGHVGRRFFAGFSTMDSSGCPLHDGMFKKHVWRTLIFEFGSNTFFFKNKLWYQLLGYFQNSNTHNLFYVRIYQNLSYVIFILCIH